MIKNKTLLFIHQNFPGQFLHLCRALARDNRVLFITKPTTNRLKGVQLIEYKPHRAPAADTHSYLKSIEDGVLHAQAVARHLLSMQKQDVRPDIIIGHSGWGETLFVKDVFPDVPLLSYIEFYYNVFGADVNFDPEFPSGVDLPFQLRSRNQMILSCLEATDRGLSPTAWQQSQIPEIFRSKVEIIHDGVDTAALAPSPDARFELPNGLRFDGSTPLVTYVARNLEPYRGFHVFMRAVRPILERVPNAHVVVVGGDGVSYGARLPNGETYKQRALAENPINEDRVHFVGRIPYEMFKRLLQVSSAHVYLTYPFVLSWSMLEAMSTGCLVIGSRTAPVMEAIEDGRNGILVDFFSPEEIAEAVAEALLHPARFTDLRKAARQTVIDRYDLQRVSLPQQTALLQSIMS